MATLRIPGGRLEGGGDRIERRAGGKLKVTRRAAVGIERARGAEGPTATVTLTDQDVLGLELEGGFKLWIRGDDFRKEFGAQTRRGAKPDEWELSPEIQLGSPERGVGTWLLKGLEVFDVDLTGIAASRIAEQVEAKLDRKPGLYACNLAERYGLKEPPANLPADRPLLLFIHGTASSTSGSFGGLWGKQEAIAALERQYADTAFAFEHRTLTQSPLQNALDLVSTLPKGARLHLVSHSGGGLVGELLCRGRRGGRGDPFEARENVSLFDRRGEERKALEELNRALKEKQITVERFVRVACPARGTTLASGRLDRWLSVVVNLAGQIPGLKGNPLYEALTDFLVAVVKERTDPTTLPGLEAMMPGSPLIRLLNLPGVQVDADLSVISGDTEAEGFWGKIKLLIPDLFYGGDHDLVVNTGSMYGGAVREKGARFFLDRGPEVNHFRYFANDKTVRMLVDGLTRADSSQAGFTPIEKARQEVPARAARGATGPRPTVLLVPGIMGSHLAVDGDRIWLDPLDLAFGGFRRLTVAATDVAPQALIGLAYGDLVEYLSETHEVVSFPYDWRLSIRKEAGRLAEAVERALDSAERVRQPVRLLAHSMGGLLVRAMIADRAHIWKRICQHPGGRLIMLGTPNGGSYVIVKLLVGQEGMFRYLALLDITHSEKELLEIISRYPGALEMLPENGTPDFFSAAYWSRLKAQDRQGDWVLPEQIRLQAAAAFRQVLEQSPIDTERMLYVAGCSPATPCGVQIAEGQIEFLASARGDGRVLWNTGIPPGVKTWYMEGVEHGDLADHAAAFPAVLELLQTGNTTRLPSTPPVAVRGAPETFPMPREVVPMLPDEDTLAAAAVGSRRRAKVKAPVHAVRVSITHGNLGYARHAVAVGHYHGDSIVGAEAYLDKGLQGRLRSRQQLGLYPGGLNTAEVFLPPDPFAKPGGAIVVGLGRVGELSPGGLTSTFARAALAYARAVAEAPDARFQTATGVPRSARITSLLIGTGAGGFSVEESVDAILRGVFKANALLQEAGQDKQVLIDEVEFMELWRDLAIQAGRALERVGEDPELRGHFKCDPRVRQGQGGLSRVCWQEDPQWWHRLQILAEEDGSLRFSALTQRARAEVSLLPTQRALVDRFIEEAITTTASSRETARTLFEMLVPDRLKEQAPNRYNVVLILNEESARYPWELLEDRWGGGTRPLAVEAGVIRQLETVQFRERVRMTTQDTAYVVGDPVSNFVPLPGAEAEARKVADQLAARGFTVEKQIRADARDIVATLHAKAYRILHLAGHGVHEEVLNDTMKLACDLCGQPRPEKQKKVSGMVIGENILLAPADVKQMRQVPELVFINCCHLGRTDGTGKDTRRDDRHRLAANVATEFIRLGVKAVIAAGWAVDDAAAGTFAETFYDAVVDGVHFGEAVRLARSETHQRHPHVNTWGAYQCYGDPSYQLRITEPSPIGAPEQRSYVSPAEAVAELENLASAAKTASDEGLKDLTRRLDQILKRTDAAWLRRGDVAAALGLAHGELGEFQKAVEDLDHALEANQAEFPVRAVEQRANLKGRWAVDLFRSGQKAPGQRTPSELIQDAIRELEALRQFGSTAERLSLLGSAHKRRAWIAGGEERKRALESMASSYQDGHDLAYNKGRGRLDTYPLLNWLAAETLLSWYERKRSPGLVKKVEDWCQKAEAHAAEKEKADPDFWNSVVKPECDLIRALVRKTLDQQKQAVVEGYRRAKTRGASPREFRSVIEHLEFLADVAAGAGPGKDIQTQAEALRAITEQLSSAAG